MNIKEHLTRPLSALEAMMRKTRRHVEVPEVLIEPSVFGEIAAPTSENVIHRAQEDMERELASLSDDGKKRVLEKLDEQLLTLNSLRDRKTREVVLLKDQLKELQDLMDWWDALDPKRFSLERNDCSRLHRFIDASINGRVFDKKGRQEERAECYRCIKNTFVVRHNWAAAFDKAEGLSDAVRLPYDIAGFEFRIAGRSVICIAADVTKEASYKDGDWPLLFHAFIEAGERWYSCGDRPENEDFTRFMWSQIRAILIALDAEVATHEVIRAPAELNRKREKQGKTPLLDYYVVDLAHRHRVSNPSYGESGKKYRMHFVRGHWRHYEDRKTWIKWHLRGNPDLGFIQKHYAL